MRKQILLSILGLGAALTVGAVSQPGTPEAETVIDLNNPNLGNLSLPCADPAEAVAPAPFRAQGQDTIRVTFRWKVSSDASRNEKPQGLFLFKELGQYANLPAADMQKVTTGEYVVKCFPGRYNAVLAMTTNLPESSLMRKVFVRENLNISADTTLLFDSDSETVLPVGFRHTLPNGEAVKIPYRIDNKTIGYDGVNSFRFSMDYNFRHKDLLPTITGGYTVLSVAALNAGTDQTQMNRMFITPGLSDKWYIQYLASQQPIDTKTHAALKGGRNTYWYSEVAANVLDTIYTNTPSDFVEYKQPKIKLNEEAASKLTYFGGFTTRRITKKHEMVPGLTLIMSNNDPQGTINLVTKVTDPELTYEYYYSRFEMSGALKGSAASGIGISLPRTRFGAKQGMDFCIYDAEGAGYSSLSNQKKGTPITYGPAHPVFSYSMEDQDPDFGNTAPILSMPFLITTPADSWHTDAPGNLITANWIANGGEVRDVDVKKMSFLAIVGKDTITNNWAQVYTKLRAHAATNASPDTTRLIFDNRYFTVDTMQGHAHAELTYFENREDICPPTPMRYQLRNGQGKITNRFNEMADATLNFIGGDYNCHYDAANKYLYFDYTPATTVRFELSAMGRNRWYELKATPMPEYDAPMQLGTFYRASFAGFNHKSENGWFDLRVTMTDARGNKNVQTLSPFMFVDKSTGVSGNTLDSAELVNDGNQIHFADNAEATFTLFSADGRVILRQSGQALATEGISSGVYIVSAVRADGSRAALKLAK